ncbi:hypothetical protein TW65_01436 [Stemphylium lycopersici]|nr:hypothetical protein TW65_01436 [Stemphylium lycopersici]
MKFPSSLLFLVPLASARPVEYAQQIPITGETADGVDGIRHDAVPGIGVHFTASYAVAAAHYESGETKDLVRIDGDAEYTELMLRWTDESTKHANQVKSNDDAVLASFMTRIRRAIETELDGSMRQTALALPPLPSGLQQKFREASKLTLFEDEAILYEESMATHASLKPTLSCSKPSHPGQHQHVLFLAFDEAFFSASMHEVPCGSNSPQARMVTRISHSDLGWWRLPVYEAPRAKFWAKVQEGIVHVLSLQQRPPGRIVLLGSHGADPEFKNVVEEAVWSELEVDISTMLSVNAREDSQWLAARGAAELIARQRRHG